MEDKYNLNRFVEKHEADYKKVRSCMTLFYLATNNELFKQVLIKYYRGQPDDGTLIIL